jgi:hypothetical protein
VSAPDVPPTGEWQRRFVAGPPELTDVAALYEALGYEVYQGRIAPGDMRPECGDCRLALGLFRVIYTRRVS